MLDVTCCLRLHTLLHAVACCCTKFETGQTFSYVQTDTTTPNIVFFFSFCILINFISFYNTSMYNNALQILIIQFEPEKVQKRKEKKMKLNICTSHTQLHTDTHTPTKHIFPLFT